MLLPENHVLAEKRGLTQPIAHPNTAALDPKFYDAEGYWTSFYMEPHGCSRAHRLGKRSKH